MEQSAFRRYSILGQTGAWTLYFLIMFTSELPNTNIYNSFLFSLNLMTVHMVLVYGHYHLLLPLFHQGKKVIYFVLTALVTVILTFLCMFSDYYIVPYSDVQYGVDDTWHTVIYLFPLSVFMVGASSFYHLIQQWHANLKKESELRHEKLQAELNFLRSQINPHFLFNTLNNIYSFVQMGDPKAGPMLERLSSVLRYMVYDCSGNRVELVKELQSIEDLLKIYQIKNSEQKNIKLHTSGVKGHHLIAPLIIINLVENACKHSDAISNLNGFIQVKVEVEDLWCAIEIANSVKLRNAKVTEGGLGLENIKKRLELQYDELYSIQEIREDRKYTLKLRIPLDKKH